MEWNDTEHNGTAQRRTAMMRRYLFWVMCATVLVAAPSWALETMSSVQLLTNATTTVTGGYISPRCINRTFQAMGTTSSGSGSGVVVIEASNKSAPDTGTNVDWTTLGTITLTLGTTQTNDGFVSAASWRFVRARVSSISGTGASVNAHMGCGS